jgi:hypothetical protein
MDDLAIAKKGIANPTGWIQNSTSRTQARQEKKDMKSLQTQRRLEQLDQEEEESRREHESLLAGLKQQAMGQKILASGNKQKDSSRFQFEDYTGEQEELNNKIDELIPGLHRKAEIARKLVQVQGKQLDHHNAKTTTMREDVSAYHMLQQGAC